MRRALPFFLLLLILAMTGCGDKQALNLPHRPKRYHSIVSLSPSTTEIIVSNADTAALKGRTSSCNWPEAIVKGIPVVASVKPDFEKIQAIDPKVDLIVYAGSLYSQQDIDKIKSMTGADTFSLDATTVKGFILKLQEFGSKLASEMRFNDYINRIYLEKGAASGGSFATTPKVAIIMPGKAGDDYIVGTDGFLADVVKICNGQIVGPKGAGFVPMNAESLVSLNPDAIIVPGTKFDVSAADKILKDPRFATVAAVKQKRVGVIDEDVLLREGQRVDQLITAVHRLIAPPTN